MSYSRRSRYSLSPSPYMRYSRSDSRSLSRSLPSGKSKDWNLSRESSDAENPGNNLYVTGLPARVTKRDLEKHFSAEEMARRRRGRTPTLGRYLGLRIIHGIECHVIGSLYVVRGTRIAIKYPSNFFVLSVSTHSVHRRSRSGCILLTVEGFADHTLHITVDKDNTMPTTDVRGPPLSHIPRTPVSMHDRSYSPYYRDYSPDYYYGRGSRYQSASRSVSPTSTSRNISPRAQDGATRVASLQDLGKAEKGVFPERTRVPYILKLCWNLYYSLIETFIYADLSSFPFSL
ncbi:hypothetical protein ACH5RR_010163 [Cinchona calisaya]|uniref:RRM domain-containing protein n=1 Tax=Cinchona calisaya TaxID=153742 RepID=A0ABD3AGB8_9GENT